MTFTEGLEIQYKEHIGTVRFVCDTYITMCVNAFPKEKRRDVCILIYRNNFDQVRLLKESTK